MEHNIHRAATIGSGYMGGGISQMLALAGVDIALADVDAATAEKNRQRLVAQARTFEADGLFDKGAADVIAEHLSAAESIADAVKDADYVTEAVSENPELKGRILAEVAAHARPDAIITTNTSAIPITTLAEQIPHPERFLGVHWMNPAPFVPGVEIISGPKTASDVVDRAEALILAAGKTPARMGDSPGFVANRLQFALYKECLKVVEEGVATPEMVDKVVSSCFGFRLSLFGPFAIGDMAGLDVYHASYKTLESAFGERLAAPESLNEKVAAGDIGIKSGRGFLDIPAEDVPGLLAHRDKAYRRLDQLRKDLGQAPGL